LSPRSRVERPVPPPRATTRKLRCGDFDLSADFFKDDLLYQSDSALRQTKSYTESVENAEFTEKEQPVTFEMY